MYSGVNMIEQQFWGTKSTFLLAGAYISKSYPHEQQATTHLWICSQEYQHLHPFWEDSGFTCYLLTSFQLHSISVGPEIKNKQTKQTKKKNHRRTEITSAITSGTVCYWTLLLYLSYPLDPSHCGTWLFLPASLTPLGPFLWPNKLAKWHLFD